MYRCLNSTKCISKQRLVDGIRDCPFDDDEIFNQSCLLNDVRQRFKCYSNGQEKCFASLIIEDKKEDCTNGVDENIEKNLIRTSIYFQTICDVRTDLLPILIDDEYETDETKCDDWPCSNTYTRCNRHWLCKDGADEVDCLSSTCPVLHHSCIFHNDTSKVSCLPIHQAGDGIDNCLGGTDERKSYSRESMNGVEYDFHCWNDSKSIKLDKICNNQTDCKFNDDESFCKNFKLSGLMNCHPPVRNIESFVCKDRTVFRAANTYFKLYNMKNYPLSLSTDTRSAFFEDQDRSLFVDPIEFNSDYEWLCNRGITIRIRMDDDTKKSYCLCPPSYSGDKCQYQNQRVSLTVQIQISEDWQSIFIFLITLIDNERNIQSHDHIEYLPIRECRNKYNIYLLYSTSSKNLSKTYSVQIDAFNQLTLNYRISWIFPLRFPFLPVHRLAVLLKIPAFNINVQYKCMLPCIHGQCFAYINDPMSTFCRCEPRWSGVQCDIEYECNCSADSVCISDSICLCPPGRFGSRCYLSQHSSYAELCLHGGQYIPKDIRHVSSDSNDYICICKEEYTGPRCQYEKKRTRIHISFHRKVSIPSLLLVHFVTIGKQKKLKRRSIFKKIGFVQYSLVVYVTEPFNIAFAEMSDQYYLIVLMEKSIVSSNISTEIIPSHRCRSIIELFNETFANQHLLKNIKFYHSPCKKHLDLVCFYDKVHFCLCNRDRQANCFEFDHNMNYTCGEYNICENKGYCFQDDPKCPTPSICGCRQCSFGRRCQFSTTGATLSLDIILGYHIQPRTGISQQSIIIKCREARNNNAEDQPNDSFDRALGLNDVSRNNILHQLVKKPSFCSGGGCYPVSDDSCPWGCRCLGSIPGSGFPGVCL
ncbi:hypothetical protein I4U23_016795 [Adineta vaga]|nr:hypothetical protein I4U23_016795 [Adineta vaga]